MHNYKLRIILGLYYWVSFTLAGVVFAYLKLLMDILFEDYSLSFFFTFNRQMGFIVLGASWIGYLIGTNFLIDFFSKYYKVIYVFCVCSLGSAFLCGFIYFFPLTEKVSLDVVDPIIFFIINLVIIIALRKCS